MENQIFDLNKNIKDLIELKIKINLKNFQNENNDKNFKKNENVKEIMKKNVNNNLSQEIILKKDKIQNIKEIMKKNEKNLNQE